jgi:DNA-binding transcriptional regulator YiaG
MPTNINDIIKQMTPEQQRRIKARAAELIAEEMTLRDLRHARKLTQQKLAKSMKMGQGGISKLEQRSDLLISTLRNYVRKTGGRLRLVAEYPDRPPIEIAGFAAMENERRKKKEHVGDGR